MTVSLLIILILDILKKKKIVRLNDDKWKLKMICVARDTYQCSPTECVLWSKVCDGIAHCSNKADENCGKKNKNFLTTYK